MRTAIISTTLVILSLYTTPVAGVAAPTPATAPWVAIQPPPARFHKTLPSDQAIRRHVVLAAYFGEKLAKNSGIRLVSEWRAASLFQILTDPDNALPLEQWFETASRMLPVEAIVTFPVDTEELTPAAIILADRVLRLPAPEAGETLIELVRRTAIFLADALALSDADRGLMLEIGFPDDDVITATYLVSRLTAAMPDNSGEYRLRQLQPVLVKHPDHPRLGEVLLRAVIGQFHGVERSQTFTPEAIRMAQAGLPAVLGTPFEAAAEELVRIQPEIFGPTLIRMLQYDAVKATLDSAIENFDLDSLTPTIALETIAPPEKEKAPDPWSEIRPVQRQGALRVLGAVASPTALPTLIDASRNDDPLLREAAAQGLSRRAEADAVAALRRLANDAHAGVARAAMLGLWRHQEAPTALMSALRTAPDAWLQSVPMAAEAFVALSEAQDLQRLRALQRGADNGILPVLLKARFRLGDIPDTELLDILRYDSIAAVIAALQGLGDRLIDREMLDAITRLADQPDPALAAASYEALAPHHAQDADGGRMFHLNYGSPYHRLSLLAGHAAREDPVAAAEFLAVAASNSLAMIRYKALHLMAGYYPEQAVGLIPGGLADSDPWVRMQAAAMAVDHNTPALTPVIRAALESEESESIQAALQVALAKATGAPLPPPYPAANPHDNTRKMVWTRQISDKDLDYTPIEAFLCYWEGTQIARDHGKHVYARTLWGRIPSSEAFVRDPQVYDQLWHVFENSIATSPYKERRLLAMDGFDLKILGLGGSWIASWRDFCREAGIDASRIAGDTAHLTLAEQRAFSGWNFERGISGFNIMYDLLKLKHRFIRPNMQVLTWIPWGLISGGEVSAPMDRWKNDLSWSWNQGTGLNPERYLMTRMCRTFWPDRATVYFAPEPGGSSPIYHNTPMPDRFIHHTPNDLFSHTLLAWLGGGHLKLITGWQFVAANAPAEGGANATLSLLSAGPDPQALDAAIELAFKDVIAHPPTTTSSASANPLTPDGGAALDIVDGLMAGLLDGPSKEDPNAPLKKRMRIGVRLLQKHTYDCARIFASLPRHDPRPDVLVLYPGMQPSSDTAPSGAPPINAARDLAGEFDLLPGINLVADRDLNRYRMILVHNATLLRDDTIRKLTQWLKTTPGLLVIHQDLTADPSAQFATVEHHDGQLRETWPWAGDLTIHPAEAGAGFSTTAFDLHVGTEAIAITADAQRSYAVCHTPRAEALAQIDGQTVMARWRDPDYRGAVLFDGLRSPGMPYVERLSDAINRLAAEGIGKTVTGRPGMLEVKTESFHVLAIQRPKFDGMASVPMQGIDLLSGAIDPTVGPGTTSAIVPLQNYFHRYLACTPDLVALGELEFSRSEAVDGGGMLLHNPGIIQIAGRTPPRIRRVDGKPLAQLEFDFAWVLDGATEGIATYTTDTGGLLTFVRCAEAIRVEP